MLSFFCYAKDKNESNEVLFIDDLNFKSEVQILGEEFVVSPAKNPFAVSVVKKMQKGNRLFIFITTQVQIIFL